MAIQPKPFASTEQLESVGFVGRPAFFNAIDLNKQFEIFRNSIKNAAAFLGVHSTVEVAVSNLVYNQDEGNNERTISFNYVIPEGFSDFAGVRIHSSEVTSSFSETYSYNVPEDVPRAVYFVLTGDLVTKEFGDGQANSDQLCGIQSTEYPQLVASCKVNQYINVGFTVTTDPESVTNSLCIIATVLPKTLNDTTVFEVFQNAKYFEGIPYEYENTLIENQFIGNNSVLEYLRTISLQIQNITLQFGVTPGKVVNIAQTLVADRIVEIAEITGTTGLISVAKGTAYNRHFGIGPGNVPAIESTLALGDIVEVGPTGGLVTAAKNTAYNKTFGIQPGDVPYIAVTLGGDKLLKTNASGYIITTDEGAGATANFGINPGDIPNIGATLVANRIIETNGSGYLITVAKNSAYNKNFGITVGTVPTIGATLVSNRIVVTNGSANLTTETKNTAFNKSFGTTAGTIVNIGATLAGSSNVETNSSGHLITVVKGTAHNKSFQNATYGGSLSTVSRGDHRHRMLHNTVTIINGTISIGGTSYSYSMHLNKTYIHPDAYTGQWTQENGDMYIVTGTIIGTISSGYVTWTETFPLTNAVPSGWRPYSDNSIDFRTPVGTGKTNNNILTATRLSHPFFIRYSGSDKVFRVVMPEDINYAGVENFYANLNYIGWDSHQ